MASWTQVNGELGDFIRLPNKEGGWGTGTPGACKQLTTFVFFKIALIPVRTCLELFYNIEAHGPSCFKQRFALFSRSS